MGAPSVIQMRDVTIVVSTIEATPAQLVLTEQVDSTSLTFSQDVNERTTFGNDWKQHRGGLKGGSWSVDFYQELDDGTVASVNGFFNAAFFSGLGYLNAVVTENSTGAEYEFDFMVDGWTPLEGGVADDSHSSFSFTIKGDVTYTSGS